VFRILANDHDAALALDDFAFLANALDRRFYLHLYASFAGFLFCHMQPMRFSPLAAAKTLEYYIKRPAIMQAFFGKI
jgi:hypothetical protein